MTNVRFFPCMTVGALAFVAIGCSGSVNEPTNNKPTPGFVDTTGETASQVAYPAGPYGIGIGSIIPNFDFIGFGDATATQANTQVIHLSDFYNPHAGDASYKPASPEEDDRLFPADSGFALAGKAKPTVLLIDIASVWCGPCNEEAQHLLPFKHDMYSACGGEFLLDLHDSNTPGTTATIQNLKNWTKLYKVNYPSAIDPEYKLDPLFAADAFPNNMIVRTKDMTIAFVVAGEVVPGVCSDNQTICGTTADLAQCATQAASYCGGLAACPSGACTQYDFWTVFESELDKTRTGCTVQ